MFRVVCCLGMHAPQLDVSSSSSEEDEWETVPRYRGKLSHTHNTSDGTVSNTVQEKVEDGVLGNFMARLNAVKDKLADILDTEGFWERYRGTMRGCNWIAAYGIGSSSESKASLYQFSLLLLLIEKLGVEKHTVEFHEPQLCSLDIAVLEQLGLLVNPLNVTRNKSLHILCFMPHCDRIVYEQIIYQLVEGDCEFTLVSNLLTSYEREFETWVQVNQYLKEEPIFIWRRDSEKFALYQKECRNLALFKAKYAQSSFVIPFEAFNDLAIISKHSQQPGLNLGALDRLGDSWNKLDKL